MTTNLNNREDENFLFGKDKKNPFVVPTGYFGALPGILLNKIEVIQELEQYPTLSAVSKVRLFSVPQNYFIKNENLLEYKYELVTFNELGKIPKLSLKPLADEYLDAISTKVLKQIEQAEELKNYSTLSAIDKKKVFDVSPDYFDTVADKVKERYHAEKDQKVSVFEQLLNTILKPKIAFAYSIVLITAVGLAVYFNQPNTLLQSSDCKTLACLERNELLNDRTMQNLDEDNLYDLVDVDELDRQLSGSTADSLANNNIDSLPN
ncbi:MAG: hypothetical protein ACT4ON_09035 [Bacteroidota bacterium]